MEDYSDVFVLYNFSESKIKDEDFTFTKLINFERLQKKVFRLSCNVKVSTF